MACNGDFLVSEVTLHLIGIKKYLTFAFGPLVLGCIEIVKKSLVIQHVIKHIYFIQVVHRLFILHPLYKVSTSKFLFSAAKKKIFPILMQLVFEKLNYPS
ncbi:hypothetical protein GDO86_015219 [Hymenochirus boettgeri]|uniref:Uncharacterized protein n=1 Tax=Hymenochirus boettgeri TaxID=247094 RepID=A0A8T2K0C9_9PIPI|nr:hypothetical protein GDO86_015219 [Hymenochirus boettgeri]